MAHSRTAQKRVRQTETLHAYNRWRLRTVRTALKDFAEQVMHGTPDTARKALNECVKQIDRASQRGVIHKNQAARRKSRLSAKLKAKVAAKR